MMKISEVMKETGLTRKAIYYYEEMGLIHPNKEDDSFYRNYSEVDIERLKQIRALRLLDVSLQKIKEIFESPTAFKEVMEEQLNSIKEKIHLLNETERMIKSLLDHDNPTLQSYNLDQLNHYLDLSAKATKDYMKKELERIFPSGFGKLLAVLYGAFLDEPIDTEEKEQAWENLVNTLDATEIVQFPDEISDILDYLYGQFSQDGMDQFKLQCENIISNVISFKGNIPEIEKEEIDRRMQIAQEQEGFTEMVEMTKKLFEYIKENPNILPPDIFNYLKVLSSKFNDFVGNLLITLKSRYSIGKTFGTN